MFQHTERRVELGCEQQRDMEQAFEGLFIKTHGRLYSFFLLHLCLPYNVVVSHVPSSPGPTKAWCGPWGWE